MVAFRSRLKESLGCWREGGGEIRNWLKSKLLFVGFPFLHLNFVVCFFIFLCCITIQWTRDSLSFGLETCFDSRVVFAPCLLFSCSFARHRTTIEEFALLCCCYSSCGGGRKNYRFRGSFIISVNGILKTGDWLGAAPISPWSSTPANCIYWQPEQRGERTDPNEWDNSRESSVLKEKSEVRRMFCLF